MCRSCLFNLSVHLRKLKTCPSLQKTLHPVILKKTSHAKQKDMLTLLRGHENALSSTQSKTLFNLFLDIKFPLSDQLYASGILVFNYILLTLNDCSTLKLMMFYYFAKSVVPRNVQGVPSKSSAFHLISFKETGICVKKIASLLVGEGMQKLSPFFI